MSTSLQPPASRISRRVSPVERPVSDIIDRARSSPAPRLGAILATVLTGVLLWLAFTPVDLGPLAWIALAPWLMLARIAQPTRWMYRCVYLGGVLYWIPTLIWMRLGDPMMILGCLALALYLAVYFPVALGVIRTAVHRLRIPLTIAAPVVWIGLEYLRTHLMTGFGWYLLGHSQHEFTSLVQISDLFGAYGVSFVVMFAAAALTECIPVSWFPHLRLLPPICVPDAAVVTAPSRHRLLAVVSSIVLVSASVGYGVIRSQHDPFPTGPRVGLIQGDFRSEVKHDPNAVHDIYRRHVQLTGMTVDYRPDVIIWPETMFPYLLLQADPSLTREQLLEQFPQTDPSAWTDPRTDSGVALRDKAEQAGASMIVGVVAQVASKEGGARYNSAVLVEPQAGITGRYDKIHRVPFGEYIPLKDWLPFLASFSPFGSDNGIAAGKDVHSFQVGTARFLPLICFEDTVPHLVRRMVNAVAAANATPEEHAQVDCLVNLTNDGWFRDSSEQEQHLITASFRCIETRTPMV
ncbi:MAG: apolipoprotein N-acyltransferase, partial [Planctomycetaceae bacterium]|nr:apolipoprotein N-acyltransferase [Planctomycetaceae bacterium]